MRSPWPTSVGIWRFWMRPTATRCRSMPAGRVKEAQRALSRGGTRGGASAPADLSDGHTAFRPQLVSVGPVAPRGPGCVRRYLPNWPDRLESAALSQGAQGADGRHGGQQTVQASPSPHGGLRTDWRRAGSVRGGDPVRIHRACPNPQRWNGGRRGICAHDHAAPPGIVRCGQSSVPWSAGSLDSSGRSRIPRRICGAGRISPR